MTSAAAQQQEGKKKRNKPAPVCDWRAVDWESEVPSATDLNLIEHQLVPQAVVAHDSAPELRLLPPDGVMEQSPPQRRVDGTPNLCRGTEATAGRPRLVSVLYFVHDLPVCLLEASVSCESEGGDTIWTRQVRGINNLLKYKNKLNRLETLS